jgi:uncharacterized damage-inducible protein DinB
MTVALEGTRTSGDLMIEYDSHDRPKPPPAGDEVAILTGFLDFHRATLAWKCSGLDEAGLTATAAASSITLGALLKHLAFVEDYWFSYILQGNDPQTPWDTADWDADPDCDWHSASTDAPGELFALWSASVERSRELAADVMSHGGLESLAKRTRPDGATHNLRWIMVHMIEEYARHNGHADIIRESVDGSTGE